MILFYFLYVPYIEVRVIKFVFIFDEKYSLRMLVTHAK